jgi:hypothetical protein
MRRNSGLILLVAVLAPVLRGDATLRYHTDIQTASGVRGMTPEALDGALRGMREMVVRIKGNKAYSVQGNLTSIVDLTTQDMTLMDVAHKHFATVPAGQYAQQVKGAIPAIPDQARAALASMKTNLESRSTGRTAAIQGVQSEEHEFVLTMDMALPGGPPATGPLMKLVMQVWTAKPEETQRLPALQEFRNYTASASSSLNPVDMIKQILGGLPGMGDSLGSMIGEISNQHAMMMRMHAELFMPILAAISKQGGSLPPGFDPAAPLMQMTQEVAELSTDPLDDAAFQVPADYQAVSLEEVLRGAMPAPAAPKPQQ